MFKTLARFWRRFAAKTPGHRGWNCPDEETIASFAENSLAETKLRGVLAHLTGCDYCRELVADVVRLRRNQHELPYVPAAALARAREILPGRSHHASWAWLSAGAAGAFACSVFALFLLHMPESSLEHPWQTPPPPAIAKSSPALVPLPTSRELVRKPPSIETLPQIVSPSANARLDPGPLEIRWSTVTGAQYYEVRVLSQDGEVAWKGVSASTQIAVPETSLLKRGIYFVTAKAVMANGRERKSEPVEFRVGR